MNSQARHILVMLAVTTLILTVAQSAQAQYPDYYRRVLLVHVSGGVALPVAEEADDKHDLGFDLGIGLGLMLPGFGPISPEADVRFNFYRLPISATTDRYILNEANNEYSFGLEGRFRYMKGGRLKPFGIIGPGLYKTAEAGAKYKFAVTIGGGIDLSFDPKEQALFYFETRYIAGPRNMLRFDVGVRIG